MGQSVLRGGARNKSRYSILIRNAARSFREILLKMFEKYSSGEPISPSKGGPGTKAHTPFYSIKRGVILTFYTFCSKHEKVNHETFNQSLQVEEKTKANMFNRQYHISNNMSVKR